MHAYTYSAIAIKTGKVRRCWKEGYTPGACRCQVQRLSCKLQLLEYSSKKKEECHHLHSSLKSNELRKRGRRAAGAWSSRMLLRSFGATLSKAGSRLKGFLGGCRGNPLPSICHALKPRVFVDARRLESCCWKIINYPLSWRTLGARARPSRCSC